MTSAHLFLQVGVPLEVVHLTDEYWEKVVSTTFLVLSVAIQRFYTAYFPLIVKKD